MLHRCRPVLLPGSLAESAAGRHLADLLENFAASVTSPETTKLCSSARENLENMAVIESAYLSARTGFPEEPGRILQMASRPVDEGPGD